MHLKLIVLLFFGFVHVEAQKQYTVSHSSDGGQTFSPRGVLEHNSEDGTTTFKQDPLSAEMLSALKAGAKSAGFYNLRVSTDPSSGLFVSTLVRACSLLNSRLQDSLTFHFSSGGQVIGLDYSPANKSCINEVINFQSDKATFKTKVILTHKGSKGPTPVVDKDTKKKVADHLKKVEGSKPQYDSEGKPIKPQMEMEEESFMTKYWMYIVPGLVLYMLMNAVPDGGEDGAVDGTGGASAQPGPRRQ